MPRNLIAALLVAFALSASGGARPAQRIVFPPDVMVVNVKTQFGAVGDGKTDDTQALQNALNAGSTPPSAPAKTIYLPNGTYLVRSTLIVNKGATGNGIGPFFYGEHRDSVIIKLADGAMSSGSVLQTWSVVPGSADWFMRTMHNFTIDIGNNRGVSGIDFFSNNTGILKDVRVIGNRVGRIGIKCQQGLNGPNLIQDVVVEGFQVGITSVWLWGQTFSRVTIRDCDSLGLRIIANVAAVESLVVENTPMAVHNTYSDGHYWWCGVTTLVNCIFRTAASTQSAILNDGVLYARNITTSGYASAIKGTAGTTLNAAGPNVELFTSTKGLSLFADAPLRSLDLPIKSEPFFPWETDISKWVSVSDYGAVPGDRNDDTQPIQAAIDAAAAAGKTTVFFRGGQYDPSYNLTGTVYVRGSVRHLIGLGFTKIIGGSSATGYPNAMGRFVVDDQSASVVKFQNLHYFAPAAFTGYENRSQSNTMIVESGEGTVLGRGKGDIFVTDFAGWVYMDSPGQRLWARQLNPENSTGAALVHNSGGIAWILGRKSEGNAIQTTTTGGGFTETLGFFHYSLPGQGPVFSVNNGACSFTGMREYTPGKLTTVNKVVETRGDTVRTYAVTTSNGFERWDCALFSAFSSNAIAAARQPFPSRFQQFRKAMGEILTVQGRVAAVTAARCATLRGTRRSHSSLPPGAYVDLSDRTPKMKVKH